MIEEFPVVNIILSCSEFLKILSEQLANPFMNFENMRPQLILLNKPVKCEISKKDE